MCVDELRQLWISPTINSEDEPRYNILDAIFACIPNCKHSSLCHFCLHFCRAQHGHRYINVNINGIYNIYIY